jgi:hypothetical protein
MKTIEEALQKKKKKKNARFVLRREEEIGSRRKLSIERWGGGWEGEEYGKVRV